MIKISITPGREAEAYAEVERIKDKAHIVCTASEYIVYQHSDPKELYQPAPERVLVQAKARAREVLRERRLLAEYGGVTVDGDLWNTEQKDTARLNETLYLMQLAGLDEYPGWKISEGKYITLTKEIALKAALAVAQHFSRVFELERIKIAEIEACATAEEVESWMESELEKGWQA